MRGAGPPRGRRMAWENHTHPSSGAGVLELVQHSTATFDGTNWDSSTTTGYTTVSAFDTADDLDPTFGIKTSANSSWFIYLASAYDTTDGKVVEVLSDDGAGMGFTYGPGGMLAIPVSASYPFLRGNIASGHSGLITVVAIPRELRTGDYPT